MHAITQCYLPPDTSERVRHNSSQTGRYSIYLSRKDGGWVDLGGWITYQDDLSVSRQSHIQVVTGLMSMNYVDRSQRANHYTTPPLDGDRRGWGSTMTAINHDGEIYPTMLNELNCTFFVSLSRFHCCGHHGRGLWPSWYRPHITASGHICQMLILTCESLGTTVLFCRCFSSASNSSSLNTSSSSSSTTDIHSFTSITNACINTVTQ